MLETDADEIEHARRRPDHADRLRPARPDRQPRRGPARRSCCRRWPRASCTNYPECYVIMLLIDERPEEVTDMERQVKGPQLRGHQLARSTSRPPGTSRSPRWSSRRPSGWSSTARDVVIFLDSITRLARAWNTEVPALRQDPLRRRRRQRPAAAQAVLRRGPQGRRRRLADDPRHRPGRHRQQMDEVIFEEFKGTGNMELVPRPPAGRQAHLAGDRHQPLAAPAGRDADGPRGATAASASCAACSTT